MTSSYAAKYKDPRWQKKRLDIFQRDNWTCRSCNTKETTLHVHHMAYRPGADPWDYPDHMLMTRCEDCHEPGTAEAYELMDAVVRAFGSSDFMTSLLLLITTDGVETLRALERASAADRERLEAALHAVVRNFQFTPRVPFYERQD